jgi:uncharacterized protein
MREEIQRQLRRLGVVKGARRLKSPGKAPLSPPVEHLTAERESASAVVDDEPQPLARLLPGGRLEETANGACFVVDKVYPLAHRHGRYSLADLCALTPAPAAQFCRDERLARLSFRDFLFLDTETTGLAGAGTLAFMVGVAFFEEDAFVVRQFFLRDHGDEPAMLLLLADLLAIRPGLITFNGRSFDLPLLDNRYWMNRMDAPGGELRSLPHIDLLMPSRRLWRSRIGSCALGSLEQQLLGLRRSQADVSGWLIPALYYDYLRTGDGREMARVFYHNEMDMISMATLATQIIRLFEQPSEVDFPQDLISLGKWQLQLGLPAEAEQNLRLAAEMPLPLEQYHEALHTLGALLKRQERRAEAAQLWRQIAVTSLDSVAAHVELAKYYEWQQGDLDEALAWTQQALSLLDGGAAAVETQAGLRQELEHRRRRLEQKASRREHE